MMTLVLLLGAIAIVGAVVVRATWRRALDERQSVRDYHHTLETLRHLSDRNPVSDKKARRASNGNGSPPAPSPAAPSPAAPAPANARSLIGRSGPSRETASTAAPIRTVAASWLRAGRRPDSKASPATAPAPTPAPAPAPAKAPAPARVSAHRSVYRAAPSQAVAQLASGSPKYKKVLKASTTRNFEAPRHAMVAAAAVVFLAAVVAVAILAEPSAKTPSHNASRSGSAVTRTTSPQPHHSAAQGHGSPTSTTAPTLQPTTSTTAAAAYSAPSSNYVVALSASGPCWILASDVSTGRVIWTGTMRAGQTQQIPVTGSILLRLGAAFSVAVTLDGEPVVLPIGHASPFNVTFQAA